jgi:putative Mn2+ efflux pump MntP
MGVMIGDRFKGKFDKYAEITAGMVLILLAMRVLVEDIIW